MRRTIISAALLVLLGSAYNAQAWGIWGHNHINKGAVLALPKEMGMFFYNHVDYIVEESTVPDIRRFVYKDKVEGARHYINLEKYGYKNEPMPRTVEEAIEKYGRDNVMEYGILPWHIQDMMKKLTDALKHKRKAEILFLAAELGHYAADAHMPLHTTVNFDGQITGQQGIHSFWESQLPEIFGREYKLYVREVKYIRNIEKASWNVIDSSYNLITQLLKQEHKMKVDNPQDKQYVMGADGAPTKNKFGQPVHTYFYAHVYHELLEGMVERQMRKSIQFVANCWYTAWVDAEKPDLSDLDNESLTERNMAEYAADMKAWKNGKVRGCKSEKEFPAMGGKQDN